MKRVFPLIVLLITLSVLGIIFIQMSWIRNAVHLKRDQHQQSVDKSVNDIKFAIRENFLFYKLGLIGYADEQSKETMFNRDFTAQRFTVDEMHEIIDNSLKANNIKEPFEFSVTNIFRYPIVTSDGFEPTNMASSIPILLNPDGSQPETLFLYIKEDKNYLLSKMGWMIAASILFTCIIISAFALTVRTLFSQKKLSEIKSDFINNMTHELKTPLATISLAIDALVNEKVIHDTEKIRYYSGMIKDENKRMNKQVEKILQAARIEKQDIRLNLQTLNAHSIIQKVTDNLTLQIQEKNGSLELKLGAAKHMIEADEVHFSNIIFNLLDNAIKYSKDSLRIQVETQNINGMFAVKVRDYGIGMTKETQARVFEKFYRAHTGNLHNVKGFGLGLSYVKAMADAHNGKVKVESTFGKGSTFTLLLPLATS